MKAIYLSIIMLAVAFSCYGMEDITYEKAYKLWALSKSEPAYLEHLRTITIYNNKQGLDEKNDCYNKVGNNVDLILIHNKEGIVISAIPKTYNPKPECFVDLFLGHQFPPPPYAPYYEHLLLK